MKIMLYCTVPCVNQKFLTGAVLLSVQRQKVSPKRISTGTSNFYTSCGIRQYSTPRIQHRPASSMKIYLWPCAPCATWFIQKSLGRKVQLKSGGHLIIDQTEAMTTIDVNTGAFVGHRNLEETIYKTNLEAAQTIARQLRLRNLGGIVIIDFIDMQETEHRRQVLRSLEKHLERDHSKVTISELTSLGLVQLTRKRTRESLE